MSRPRKFILLFMLFALCDAAILVSVFGRPLWQPFYVKLTGGRTVQQAIAEYRNDAEARLRTRLEHAGADYPPDALTFIALKEEKQLELWASDKQGGWVLIHRYPVLAASGSAGPKLREGDRQVPEGIYQVQALNPNSSYHLSIKLNYPNAFDLARADEDARDNPGTNIFIHGKAVSIGCLAIGDPAIEELFVLVERVGVDNVKVILLPHDPDTRPLEPSESMPVWTAQLYAELQQALTPYR